MASAIEVIGVSKQFRTSRLKTVVALDRVSLSVNQGEVFGFLGPNGAGKTTLIKILVGILSADEGACSIMGEQTHQRESKRRLGYLPERPYFHDFLTAEEFLFFHGRLVGLSDGKIESRIGPLLDRVDLKSSRHSKLRTFSKGMLQRIGFAQALLHDPDVLVLDEPMSGLDPVGRREVRDVINEIAMAGKTIFFSTHIIHDVEVICSTVGFIQNGKLKGSGNIESLLGKTLKSMELRFGLPFSKDPHHHKLLKAARKTMDGWVIDVESSVDDLEKEVNRVIEKIQHEGGTIKAVVPRKSTLEDLFFSGEKR